MTKQAKTGLERILFAANYSWEGLRAAFKHEPAFRQEFLLTLILIPVALYVGDNGLERSIMILVLLLVLIVELINSAIESIVDRVGVEPHELSGRAKDIASAAVFVALLNVVIVWALILFT